MPYLLPPLPASFQRDTRDEERVKRRAKLRASLNAFDGRSEDDVFRALGAGEASPAQANATLQKKQGTSFLNRFLVALERVGLPFEAFAEGMNALVSAVTPLPTPFEERGARSRETLKRLFRGELTPAETAGELRETFRERSMVEQLLTGALFDPLNFVPASWVRKPLTAGLRAAGVPERAARITGAVVSAPFGLPLTPLRKPRVAFAFSDDPTLSEVASKLRAERGESAVLGSVEAAERQTTQRARMAKRATSRLTPQLQEMLVAAEKLPGGALLFDVLVETAARPYEVQRLLVKHFVPATGKEPPKLFLPGAKAGFGAAKDLTDELGDALVQHIKTNKLKPTDLLFAGQKVETFVRQLARSAGITPAEMGVTKEQGNVIRKLVATHEAEVAMRGGFDLGTVQRILGHADLRMLPKHYLRSGLSLEELQQLSPDTAAALALRKGLKEAPGVEAEIASIRKVFAGAPAGEAVQKGKFAAGAGMSQEEMTIRGRARIDELNLSPALDAAVRKLGGQERVAAAQALRSLDAARLARIGDEAALMLEANDKNAEWVRRAVNRANSELEAAGKAPTVSAADIHRTMRADIKEIRKEVRLLRLGFLRIYDRSVKADKGVALTRALTRALGKEHGELVVEALTSTAGSIAGSLARKPANYARYGRTVKTRLAEAGITNKTLFLAPIVVFEKGTPAELQANARAFFLHPSVRQFLHEWRDGKVIQAELGSSISAPHDELKAALDAATRKGAMPALLGNDFARLTPDAQMERIEAMVREAYMPRAQGQLVEQPDKALLTYLEHKAKQPPALPPDVPGAPGALDEGASFDETQTYVDTLLNANMSPLLPTVQVLDNGMRGIPFAQWVERKSRGTTMRAGERAKLEHYAYVLARNSLEITNLRGSAAQGSTKLLIARNVQLRALQQHIQDLISNALVWGKRVGVEMSDNGAIMKGGEQGGIRVGEVLPKAVAKLRRLLGTHIPTLTGELEITEHAAMLHPRTIFDERTGVRSNELLRYYPDLTADQLAYILYMRAVPKRALRLADQISPGFARRLHAQLVKRKVDTSLPYFPSIARDSLNKRLPSIEAHELTASLRNPETLDFLIKRRIETADEALRQAADVGRFYFHPVNAAFHYAGELQALALDEDLAKIARKRLEKPTILVAGKPVVLTRTVAKEQLNAARALVSAAEDTARGEAIHNIDWEDAHLFFAKTTEDATSSAKRARELLPELRAQRDRLQKQSRALSDLRRAALPLGPIGEALHTAADIERATTFALEGHKTLVRLAEGPATAAQLMRFSAAGLDLSGLFIHGLLPAFWAPTSRDKMLWFRSVGKMTRAFFDSQYQAQLWERNKARRAFWNKYGMVLGTPEILETALPEQGVRAAWELLPGIGKIPQVRETSIRFQRAFTVLLDEMRLDIADSLKIAAKGDEKALWDIARFAGNMTGAFNTALAGDSALLRSMEGAFISFARQYRRAAFALIGTAMQPRTLVGHEARKAFGALLAAGGLFGGMMAFTGNNKKAINPASPRFMTMRFGDQYIGFGSAYYALARTGAAVYRAARDRPGDLIDFTNLDDQPLLHWWRSQASPLTGALVDVLSGRTYIGEALRNPIDGTLDVAAHARWAAFQFLPFTAENTIEQFRGVRDLAIFGEVVGGRSFPVSLYDKRTELRDNLLLTSVDADIVAWRKEQERAKKPVDWRTLPVVLQKQIDRSDERLQELNQDIDERVLKTGIGEDLLWARYRVQQKANRRYIDGEAAPAAPPDHPTLWGVQREFERGAIDGRTFREAVDTLAAQSRALQAQLAKDSRFAEIISDAERRKRERTSDDRFFGDVLYDAYLRDVVGNPDNHNENGTFRIDVFMSNRALFMETYGVENYEYVRARQAADRDTPPLVRELYTAREQLQGYWEVYTTLWPEGDQRRSLMEDYLGMTDEQQAALRERNPGIKALIKLVTLARERFRRQYPELDWALIKFGWATRPLTRLATERARAWQARAQG